MDSTTTCRTCGNAVRTDARFCGSCGAPSTNAAGESGAGNQHQAVAGGTDAYTQPRAGAEPRLPGSARLEYPQRPGEPAPPAGAAPAPSHAPGSPPPQQPAGPYGPPTGGPTWPSAGGTPSGNAPQSNGIPWAGSPSTGKDGVDALLGGDWAGAAVAALSAVGVMLATALIGVLMLAGDSEVGTRFIISGSAALVCAALGGNLFAGGAASFGSSGSGTGDASVGALPLTLTLVGLAVLAVLFLRRVRRAGPRDLLFQALRTTLVLAALTLVLALVSRVKTDASNEFFGFEARAGAGVASSLVGAILFATTALALAVFLARPAALPPRLAAARGLWRAPLFAASAVFAVGLVAALAGLVYTLSTEEDPLAQLGLAVLALPNVALGAVLLTMGVPWSGSGSLSDFEGELGDLGSTATDSNSVSLLTLTEQSAWWWIAPVVLALTLVALAVVVVVRQHTLPSARREALRFAGCFAALAAAAALLLRVGGSFGAEFGDPGGGEGTLSFNPFLAAFIAGLWGLAAAVAAPQAAGKVGGGIVHSIRGRFGTAASPPPGLPPRA